MTVYCIFVLLPCLRCTAFACLCSQVDSLKKGRSRVIESGHTLILGWSDKTLSIVKATPPSRDPY